LSEFRGCLLEGKSEAILLEKLLSVCRELELVKAGGKQRTMLRMLWRRYGQ
jgi:hypothetical protein